MYHTNPIILCPLSLIKVLLLPSHGNNLWNHLSWYSARVSPVSLISSSSPNFYTAKGPTELSKVGLYINTHKQERDHGYSQERRAVLGLSHPALWCPHKRTPHLQQGTWVLGTKEATSQSDDLRKARPLPACLPAQHRQVEARKVLTLDLGGLMN